MKLFRGQVKPVFRGPGVGMLIPERNVKPNGPDRHYINLWHCSLQCVRSHPRDSKITGVEHMGDGCHGTWRLLCDLTHEEKENLGEEGFVDLHRV